MWHFCGLSEQGLFQMLEDVPYIRQVALCPDRDRAGLQAEERIQKNLEGQGIPGGVPAFPSGKDWNEDLQELMAKGRRETCRCSREKYGKLSDYSFYCRRDRDDGASWRFDVFIKSI